MEKSILISFLLGVAITSLGIGQPQQIQQDDRPFIEVTGTIEKEIIPDEIYIRIILAERLEGKTKISKEKQETDLKNAVQSLGIDLSNLRLKGAMASYQKIKWAKKDVMARSEYLLMVKDAKTVGQVFDKLDALKITNARISKVDHSKIKAYKKETRISAIKAAKEKADYLLEAIGEETGMPLIIREQYPNSLRSNNQNYLAIANGSINQIADMGPNDLQFEKIIVRTSIYVKFTIKSGKD